MKVLLYTEGMKTVGKSGLGKALKHQMKALEENNISYSIDKKDLNDSDIVHINWYLLKSYMLAKKAKKLNKKIVYHAHSTEEDFKNSFKFSNTISPIFKWWIKKCYKMGDIIITPTEYSKRLLANYGLNKPIYAVSNGIDVDFFKKSLDGAKRFRSKYSLKKEDKVVIGIGLYLKRKGILDFVELAKQLPEYKFIWFGYLDLKLVPKEIKEAVNTKLDNLTFAGYVEPSEIKDAFSGANMYLFPTLEETEGIPILEAFSAKIPTLIRDIGVFEEYEENKCVYKARTIEEFKEKIIGILEGKLPDLTEEGYKEALKKDSKIVGKKLIELYEKLMKS